jgi:vibriolysin
MRLTALTITLVTACGSHESEPIITEPVQHSETDLAAAGPDLAADAATYVRERLGLDADDQLEVISVRSGVDGLRHARLQQIHRDIPVFGSELIAHADDSTFIGLSGVITRNLGGFEMAPGLDSTRALDIAKADRAGGVVNYVRDHARLVIRPTGARGAALAWHVVLYNRAEGSVKPGLWHYLIDADSGAVLDKYSGFHTVEQGSGPGGNARVAWSWNAEIDVEEDGGEYLMETDRLVTLDRENNDEVVKGTDLANLEDAPANDAHGFAEVVLDVLTHWMGTTSLDGAGFVVTSMVHDPDPCGAGIDNACWDSGELRMKYGEGAQVFYPLSGALDVVGHELAHGFTSFHSDLVYAGESGGLNESFSDVAGTVAEFYREGDGADWLVGEDIMIAGGALRYMCEPSMDGRSYDHVSGVDARTDPHFSSGPPNRVFCLAVQGLAAASASGTSNQDVVRRVGQVWFAANAGYWTSTSSYVIGCTGTVNAARALGFSDEEVAIINQAWSDVGVVCEGAPLVCDDDGTCDPGDGETCASCAADCGSCADRCSYYKEWKCDEGIGDCSACTATTCGDGVCDYGEDDVSCGEDCGCAAPTGEGGDHCGSVAPWGCWCDQGCETPTNWDPDGDCCADKVDVCGA